MKYLKDSADIFISNTTPLVAYGTFWFKPSTGEIFECFPTNPDRWTPIAYIVISRPPAGAFKVTNIYVDPVTRKTVVQYDDTPT